MDGDGRRPGLRDRRSGAAVGQPLRQRLDHATVRHHRDAGVGRTPTPSSSPTCTEPGMAGLLWSRPSDGSGDQRCGTSTSPAAQARPARDDRQPPRRSRTVHTGRRPVLPSDDQDPATRWRTTLPFPVQVVARVEVIDEISDGKSRPSIATTTATGTASSASSAASAWSSSSTPRRSPPHAQHPITGQPVLTASTTRQDLVPSRDRWPRWRAGDWTEARPEPR